MDADSDCLAPVTAHVVEVKGSQHLYEVVKVASG